jgi:NAD(P)-dependent dehydrogenase (short-subunit alcohol dehydrogenase family)
MHLAASPVVKRNAIRLLAGAALFAGARAAVRKLREEPLDGKVAIVTGSSRGLGFLIARELLRAGCRVVICGRNANDLEIARKALGSGVVAMTCDVSQKEDVDDLIMQTIEALGRIDIIVNNAGVIQVGPVETMTLDDFDQELGVMYWGIVNTTLAALPYLRRGARIANITSIGGKVSVPHLLPYDSAKFAAVGFSEGLHAELAKDGISVTTVVPGLMRTGSFLNAYFKGRETAEFAWFSLGSALPLISMDAERAARQIVAAIRRRDAEVILSMPAKLLATFHGVLPGVTSKILAMINRLLPQYGVISQNVRGAEADARLNSPALRKVTRLGRVAAERFQ